MAFNKFWFCLPASEYYELSLDVEYVQSSPPSGLSSWSFSLIYVSKIQYEFNIVKFQGLEKERKAAEDRRLWSLWLEKYEERLTLEKSHTQEERTKIMKENNPR